MLMLNLLAILQILLVFSATSNAYPFVKPRFLRDPGEKFGIKYMLPKPFNAKILLDSKSSLLSSELTTFDDSPDTEEREFEESYKYEPTILQHIDINAAEENFEDYSGPTITLPDSRDVYYDDELAFPEKKNSRLLNRKKRGDFYEEFHMNLEMEEPSPGETETTISENQDPGVNSETQSPISPENQDPTVSADAPETESPLPNSESQGGDETSDVTTDTTPEYTQSSDQPQDETSSTEIMLSTDAISSEGQESSTSSDVNTDFTEPQEYSTTSQQQEGEITSSTDITQETETKDIYTVPPFDLEDFLERLSRPVDRVVEESVFSFPAFMVFDY